MPRARKPKQPLADGRPLPRGLTKALAERKPGVDSELLLQEIVEVWGGPKRLAQDLYREFRNKSSTPMSRQRILEMIQRLVTMNTAHELATKRRPSDMTQEELLEVAQHYLNRLTKAAPDAEATIPSDPDHADHIDPEEEAEGEEDGPRGAAAPDDAGSDVGSDPAD